MNLVKWKPKKNGFLRCSLVHETFRFDILCRICLVSKASEWCDKRGEGGVMNLWVSLLVCNNFCQCKLTGVSEESLLSDLLEVGF
jgi:hypothetical protein